MGGLADSVMDAADENIASNRANGVSFDRDDPEGLLDGIDRARLLYARTNVWRQLQRKGMSEDWSWSRASASYRSMYSQALAIRRAAIDSAGYRA